MDTTTSMAARSRDIDQSVGDRPIPAPDVPCAGACPRDAALIWLLLSVLAVVVVAMGVVAARTPRQLVPVDADRSWAHIGDFFERWPERGSEVDLGRDWRSEVDLGAAFTLSWFGQTRELVALRYPAEPTRIAFRGGVVAPMGTPWGISCKTGLKVLATVDLAELRELPLEELRASSDGLDRLTAAIGAPYRPPDPSQPRQPPAASQTAHLRRDDPDPIHVPEPVVTVVLSDPGVRSAVGEPRVTASGQTVGHVLAEVADRMSGDDPFLTSDGTLREGLRCYVGSPNRRRDPDRYAHDLRTPLTDGGIVVVESA